MQWNIHSAEPPQLESRLSQNCVVLHTLALALHALLRSECFLRRKTAEHCVLWWNKKKAEVEEEEEEYKQERKKKIRWWRTQRVHKPTERVVCENYMYRLVEYWTNTRRAPIAFYYYYNNIEWQANEVRQAAATAKHETKTNLTS